MNDKFLTSLFVSIGFASLVVGCKTKGTEQPIPPAPVPPAQYGDPNAAAPGVPGVPGVPGMPDTSGGRFGYTTGAPTAPGATPPATTPPAPGTGLRDVRDLAPTTPPSPKPPVENKPTPPASSTPSSSDMPYANPVAGNPLAVTLPGANASLGQISVEKYDSAGKATGEPLKRGTQVQIPDPNNPGKKIYFKVP